MNHLYTFVVCSLLSFGSWDSLSKLIDDPIVWDRRRFELLWGWAYRFEAYTPAPKRKLGYYALPLLWGDRVIGWGNLSAVDGTLISSLGFSSGEPPRQRGFRRELAAELERVRTFLGLPSA